MIPFDPEVDRLTEAVLQRAVAAHVQWWRHVVVPNLCLWHEMDVAVLTRPAGCLWEFEIKVSQADWNADRKKDEAKPMPAWVATTPPGNEPGQRGFYERWWGCPRRDLSRVSRFHYVVAPGLTMPEWVPDFAGILEAEVMPKNKRLGLRVIRPPKTRKVEKPTAEQRERMMLAVYHRYWTQVKSLPAPGAEKGVG